MLVILPNCVATAIDCALDKAIQKCPDAEPDRDILRQRLLEYFDEHGEVPDFQLQKVTEKEKQR